jgi:hypothetical protein
MGPTDSRRGRQRDIEKATTAPDIVVACLIKGRLESAGIPVMLRSYGPAGWLFPGPPGSGGPVDLLVPSGRLSEARQIIAALEAGGCEDAEDADGREV